MPNHLFALVAPAVLLIGIIAVYIYIVRHPLPPVPTSLPIARISLFSFRAEYMEYCEECYNADEIPWPFKQWFETVYHYDMVDELPTGATIIYSTGTRMVCQNTNWN